MSRYEKKNLRKYHTIDEFWSRRIDPIWRHQSWLRVGIVISCEGHDMPICSDQALKIIRHLHTEKLELYHWQAGINRLWWQSRWIVAPHCLRVIKNEDQIVVAVLQNDDWQEEWLFLAIGAQCLTYEKDHIVPQGECFAVFVRSGEIHLFATSPANQIR